MNNDYLNRLEFCRKYQNSHKNIVINYIRPFLIKISVKKDIEDTIKSFVEEYEKYFFTEIEQSKDSPRFIPTTGECDFVEFFFHDKSQMKKEEINK